MDEAEPSLVAKILALHAALAAANIGHALGGALALAYYTREPRATADIDLNIELAGNDAAQVFAALPPGVLREEEDLAAAERDEQVRLWWGRTPVDLFFRASSFHEAVAERTVWHLFAGESLPFLSANDLAVFKSLFNRPKDWLDIETMADAGTLDLTWIAASLSSLLGDDQRVDKIISLISR